MENLSTKFGRQEAKVGLDFSLDVIIFSASGFNIIDTFFSSAYDCIKVSILQ